MPDGYNDGRTNSTHLASGLATMHDVVRAKVARLGESLGWDAADNEPTPMVYWNLRNTGGHPVDKNTEGAVLLAPQVGNVRRGTSGGDSRASAGRWYCDEGKDKSNTR